MCDLLDGVQPLFLGGLLGFELGLLLRIGFRGDLLIKLSELSDDPNVKAEDIIHVGDQIETYVVRVNDVEGYAELSKKRLDAAKVWENIEQAVEEKTVLEGTVTEENKGGIVVSVKGVRVFVPASQSGQPRGADLSAMVKQKVQLRITEVNRARRRVVGSIRSVTEEARKAAQAEVWANIEVGKHYTGTVQHMGDNLTGAGEGDDEQIVVDLARVPAEYDRIVLVVNIYQAVQRRQHFGMIQNAFIRIVDARNNQEMCRYNLSENYDNMTAMIFGEVYRNNGEWKFNAIGQATTDPGLVELARRYM